MKKIISLLLAAALCAGLLCGAAGAANAAVFDSKSAEKTTEQYYYAVFDDWYAVESAPADYLRPISRKTTVYTTEVAENLKEMDVSLSGAFYLYAYERRPEGESEQWLAGSWDYPAESYRIIVDSNGFASSEKNGEHIIYISGWEDVCFYVQPSGKELMSTSLAFILQFDPELPPIDEPETPAAEKEKTKEPQKTQTVFSDTPAAQYAEVYKACDLGFITGYPDGTFRPAVSVTRAEAVTMLWRMLGKPDSSYSLSAYRTDGLGDWCRGAVSWSVENGLLKGDPQKDLLLKKTITREQFVTILFRCAQMKGLNPSSAQSADSTVSAYAREAVGWALSAGLLTQIRARDAVTRAEAAAMLVRFDALA